MTSKIPVTGFKNKEEIKQEILKELNYLDSKGLLNGLKINNVDGKIIYILLNRN